MPICTMTYSKHLVALNRGRAVATAIAAICFAIMATALAVMVVGHGHITGSALTIALIAGATTLVAGAIARYFVVRLQRRRAAIARVPVEYVQHPEH